MSRNEFGEGLTKILVLRDLVTFVRNEKGPRSRRERGYRRLLVKYERLLGLRTKE
jgi:hypothetical protein